MKEVVVKILVIIVASLLTLVLLEGAYALWHVKRFQTSISYKLYETLKGRADAGKDVLPWDPNTRTITSSYPLDQLHGDFLQHGVALGNSYYDDLRTERSSMNDSVDGCKVQKPNLDKEMSYLRAGIWAPFAPVTVFYDRTASMPANIEKFIDRYGFRRIRHRTNEWGERFTLPLVESDRRVIVAGDSVANGAMLNDSETLASRLQAKDAARRYTNIGIGGADASDIICALQRAAERYRRQIEELIYIYCENDFKDDKAWGKPEEVMAWLREFVADNGIATTTVIYAPYIYNIVPNLTRFKGGYRGSRYDTHADQRRRLELLTQAAGFRYVDMGRLALEEAERTSTQFGALLLFIDRAHWSPVGTLRMAERVRSL